MAAPAAGAASWSLQSVPAVQSSNGQGFSVSCASSTACMEVGFFINPLGDQQPTAQAWNGTSWAVQTVPLPSGFLFGNLRGVSCTSQTACTAVGGAGFSEFPIRPVAERWNGTSWTLQPVPVPSGSTGASFNAVSCTSATACTAVGSAIVGGRSVAMAESWNGTSWSAETIPNPTPATDVQLNGVACTTASACIAVGHYTSSSSHFFPDKALAEGWNGSSWTIQSTPIPSGTTDATLGGVSCSAATACTAVGGYSTTNAFPNTTLAERWNGTSWTIQPTPNPTTGTPSLSSVSCPTATDCTAAGTPTEFGRAPVVEQWNGTSWALQSAPTPSGRTIAQLSGVSCPAASACTAVGGSGVTTQAPPTTLAERWNGTAWTIQTTPDNRGALPSEVTGVSCSTASSCIAVGDFNNNNGKRRMLAEAWNGSSWTNQSTPLPSTSNGILTAVSCTSPSACTAVGTYLTSASVTVTLAERWNGTGWTVQSTPNPAGSTDASLQAVSCPSATSCMAVGKSFDGATGRWTMLAEQWNGTSWTLAVPPNGGSSVTFGELTGVSCSSATACTAVGGFSTTSQFRPDRLRAAQWNGSSWSLKPAPVPAGTTFATFTGVSCSAATACTGSGGFSTTSGAQFPSAPLAERWNGTSWAVQTTTNPASTGFTGAACPAANACAAIGGSFAEGWNGTTWTNQTVAAPSAGELELAGVSCSAATACAAVGRSVLNYMTVPLFANSIFVNAMFVPVAERGPAPGSAPAARGAAAVGPRQSVRSIRLGTSTAHPAELAVLTGG